MLLNWLSLYASMPIAAAFILAGLTALAFAGATILPDWDYINSTISTAFGPFSKGVHLFIVQVHNVVADLTAEGHIRQKPQPHRGITHWWPAPLVTGGGVAALCAWNRWAIFGVLVVLYTGAIRAITVPDYMPKNTDTVRHRWSMELAHKILAFVPWMFVLKRARKLVNRKHTIHLTYWRKLAVPVGKIGTIAVAASFALIAIRFSWVVGHGPWLGAIVCLGMFLHNFGDAPTEKGIPGVRLNQFWRLPKWLAFKAGGPFEIVFLWIPMSGLGLYLLPGIRPIDEVLFVQGYIAKGLGILTACALIIEYISRYTRYRRKRTWSR
jgi:membrane-bound metal-dependent hydrolase YbcI (DUF457 family)